MIPGTCASASENWPVLDRALIARNHLSAEQFSSCCDQIWSTDRRSALQTDGRSAPQHGALLYAKQDHTNALFPKLAKKRARVVLITAESDVSVVEGSAVPPQVASWFATNANCLGVESLPLGLGNSYCRLTTKAEDLAAVAGMEKSGLLYANFRVETNPAIRGPLREKFQSGEWGDAVTWAAPGLDSGAYARTLASHRFVLCPAGNGTDTHRMWEALYAGTVPVVESHPALDAFRDLPILFVDSLYAVERGQLEAVYSKMLGRGWNCKKLFLPWWRERFESARRNVDRRIGWCAFLGQRFFRLIRK